MPASAPIKLFSVWVRRLADASRLRVDGLENARWLLRRLSDSFVFKTSEPMDEMRDSADCTFWVAHNPQMSGPRFERLLAGMPEVQLLLEPVQNS